MSSTSPRSGRTTSARCPRPPSAPRPRRMGAPTRFGPATATRPTGAPIGRCRCPRSRGRSSSTPSGAAASGTGRGGSAGGPTGRRPICFAYQELIYRLRPDWIVETRTGGGGLALFLASICDLIDTGQVLSIDDYPSRESRRAPADHLPAEPRADQRAHRSRGAGDRGRGGTGDPSGPPTPRR